jgi:rhamnosyltransferase
VLRVRAAGLSVTVCGSCSIEHALGELTPSLPWRQGFSYHPPTRRFYMTRNRLTLFREYRTKDSAWFRQIVRAELMGLAITLVFGSRRLAQVRAVVAGTRAYARGRYGLIPDDVRRSLQPSQRRA